MTVRDLIIGLMDMPADATVFLRDASGKALNVEGLDLTVTFDQDDRLQKFVGIDAVSDDE